MASWRDDLLPASFRGVEFKVLETTRDGARAWVLHDYPFKDAVWPEDMGLGPDAFTVDAYVLGEDWLAKRDELEEACLAAGTATLVLPTRGEIVAVCTKCSAREATTREGGIARFNLAFTRADENLYPTSKEDTAAGTMTAAEIAREAAKSPFADKWLVDNDPSLLDSGAALLDDLGGAIGDAFNGPLAVLSDIERRVNAVAKFRAQVLAVVRMPGQMAERLFGLLASVSSLTDAPSLSLPRWQSSTLSALSRVGSWSAGLGDSVGGVAVASGSGTIARQAAVNQAALGDLVIQAAAITAAEVAANTDFTTYDDAAAARTLVAAQLEAARNVAATDEAFQALTTLRTKAVRDITDRGAQLSRLSRVRLGATMPVEVAAYRLLGDAARADEILARNPIRHPGFVSGGTDLEVLIG